jgi:broad specificity phosphatase PhoE
VSTQRAADGNLAAVKVLESQILPTRMTLISHAPTLAIKRASFSLDEPLIEGESEKISAIGWIAPRAQHVWCGPEKRAQQTAEALGLKPCVVIELADIDYGSWSGKQIDDVQASDPEGLEEWLTNPNAAPHGGESLVQLIARVDSWMASQTSAGHIVAVTHSAVIRAAILCALQAPPSSFWRVETGPLSVTDLRFNGRFWTVRSAGVRLSK